MLDSLRHLPVILRSLTHDQHADGSWSRSGEFYKTVGKHSSILQLPKGIEETFALKGDHFTMVKFPDPVDEDYTTVAARLKQFAQMAAGISQSC
jgi:hypothetical protein